MPALLHLPREDYLAAARLHDSLCNTWPLPAFSLATRRATAHLCLPYNTALLPSLPALYHLLLCCACAYRPLCRAFHALRCIATPHYRIPHHTTAAAYRFTSPRAPDAALYRQQTSFRVTRTNTTVHRTLRQRPRTFIFTPWNGRYKTELLPCYFAKPAVTGAPATRRAPLPADVTNSCTGLPACIADAAAFYDSLQPAKHLFSSVLERAVDSYIDMRFCVDAWRISPPYGLKDMHHTGWKMVWTSVFYCQL